MGAATEIGTVWNGGYRMKYAVLNSENKIIDLLAFEEPVNNVDVFVEAQKIIHNQEVFLVKVEDESSPHTIGFIYNGVDFKPEKPFPSWLWDEDKWIWRPPSFHPEGSQELSGNYDDSGFIWNEEARQWIAK